MSAQPLTGNYSLIYWLKHWTNILKFHTEPCAYHNCGHNDQFTFIIESLFRAVIVRTIQNETLFLQGCSPGRRNLIINSAALPAMKPLLTNSWTQRYIYMCNCSLMGTKATFSTAKQIFLICNSKGISQVFQVWPCKKMERADMKVWHKPFQHPLSAL